MATKRKAYIVVNDEQEYKVLEELNHKNLVWVNGSEKPLEWLPSRDTINEANFPFVIIDNNNGYISWQRNIEFDLLEVIFDGRKETKMDNKIKINEKTYKSLIEWRDICKLKFITSIDMFQFPRDVDDWLEDVNTLHENRNRLIAIIRWVNGEDVFEVEKPKKWVIRREYTDDYGNYWYIHISNSNGIEHMVYYSHEENATKFDTKEEAESWANSHQEVVEVEE